MVGSVGCIEERKLLLSALNSACDSRFILHSCWRSFEVMAMYNDATSWMGL